ncbi:hypothetical protein LRH25_13045 [Ideonella azotifigens]|uniref:DUF4123 domain-containing protein n=1 Tax=Ideonella azotifigens TaxID=513160 RepID=A0ABN1JX49_9BURK|nr:hypothetical protein [Ideonella azotifigens]MCD2341269.1 hypothetical protein [Ideonella azotifigens]
MNRLHAEYLRLYAPDPSALPAGSTTAADLVDAQGRVRALVLALGRPADWALLSQVWQGVQADLGWPAPAIAVSGVDAFQLWFSLAEPLAADSARQLLQALCARYLPGLPAQRLDLWPTQRGPGSDPARHTAPVPAEQAETGLWSAFVSQDLAAVFVEAPWLDIPPGEEGQLTLLRSMQSVSPAALASAMAELQAQPATAATLAAAPGFASLPVACTDPRQFLLAVMNDASVPLALRIDAAKALLPTPPAKTP